MAAPAPTTTTTTAPARRRSSSTGLRARIAEEYDGKLKAARTRVAKVAASQSAAEGAGVIGAAAAGAANGYGIALDVLDQDIPLGLPVGAVTYIVGRKMGNQMVRGAGYGAFVGGLAILVDDLVSV